MFVDKANRRRERRRVNMNDDDEDDEQMRRYAMINWRTSIDRSKRRKRQQQQQQQQFLFYLSCNRVYLNESWPENRLSLEMSREK